MKYPLIAAALLALALSACDPQKETNTTTEPPSDTSIPTEQTPAGVEEVPMTPPADTSTAPAEETLGATTEPAPEETPEPPAAETK